MLALVVQGDADASAREDRLEPNDTGHTCKNYISIAGKWKSDITSTQHRRKWCGSVKM